MISKGGRFFHIDFGHFLGNFKSKYGVKRERAPFVFTNAMAEALGGTESDLFCEFQETCGQALNIMRTQRDLLISLFRLMISCGIPELEQEDDILYLENKLMLRLDDAEATERFKQEITMSMNTKTTRFNDAVSFFSLMSTRVLLFKFVSMFLFCLLTMRTLDYPHSLRTHCACCHTHMTTGSHFQAWITRVLYKL